MKKTTVPGASLPTEYGGSLPVADNFTTEPAPSIPMEGPKEPTPPEIPTTLTAEKLAEILNRWDEKVQAREDAKAKQILDTLIEQLAVRRNEEMGGNPAPRKESQAAQSGFGLNNPRQMISDVASILKQFGFIGGDEGGIGFSKFYQAYHEQADKVFLRSLAKAAGVPWHEVETEGHL